MVPASELHCRLESIFKGRMNSLLGSAQLLCALPKSGLSQSTKALSYVQEPG